MKQQTLNKIAESIILIAVGFLWWGLYYLFGKLNVPMWIYKSVLAFCCIYIPLVIIAIITAIKDSSNNKKKKNEIQETSPSIKVYG